MTNAARQKLSNLGIYLCYIVILIFFLFPIFWVFSLSLKSVPELFATPPLWFSENPQMGNYLHILENTDILVYLKNSFIIMIFTIALTLLISFPAAYALSRFKFRWKNASLLSILIFQMISPVVVAIPLYRFFVEIGLLNNYGSLILVYVAIEVPVAVWFLKGYFDTIPYDLDEAAIIDGCSKFKLLYKVLLPVCAPGIASVAILTAVHSWSQFVIPFILLDDNDLYPVSVGLVNLQTTSEAITTHYLAAASIIGILPVILLFIILQRFIVGALTNGAVKG
jgi:multiple sugar transport system permease protein